MDSHGKNIREIAELCGVSTATVSRVLNDKPDVSDEVRQRVQATIEHFQFSPKLTVSRMNVLGVALENRQIMGKPTFCRMIEALEEAAYCSGYDVLILRNEQLRHVRDHYRLFLKQKMISGLVILSPQPEDLFSHAIAE